MIRNSGFRDIFREGWYWLYLILLRERFGLGRFYWDRILWMRVYRVIRVVFKLRLFVLFYLGFWWIIVYSSFFVFYVIYR